MINRKPDQSSALDPNSAVRTASRNDDLALTSRRQALAFFEIEPREVDRRELIRTVRELLSRKNILPFGVACPDDTLLPGRESGRILASVLREDPNHMMGYEPVSGNPELGKQIAFRCIDAGARQGRCSCTYRAESIAEAIRKGQEKLPEGRQGSSVGGYATSTTPHWSLMTLHSVPHPVTRAGKD